MSTKYIIRIVAVFFILLSLSLWFEDRPVFVNIHFLWFAAFVGLNLLPNSFTIFGTFSAVSAKPDTKGGVC